MHSLKLNGSVTSYVCVTGVWQYCYGYLSVSASGVAVFFSNPRLWEFGKGFCDI